MLLLLLNLTVLSKAILLSLSKMLQVRSNRLFFRSTHSLLMQFSFLISISTCFAQNVFFSGNDNNSAYLCEDGRLFLTGLNNNGQLGNGSFISSTTPIKTQGIDGIGILPKCKQIQIEGVNTYLALTQSGDTILAWGLNEYGQVGDGTTTLRSFPTRVKGIGGMGYLENIKQIATGNSSAYAITEDSKVVSWGYNFYGQLGNGTNSLNTVYPDFVLKGPGDTLKNVKAISSGGVFCMALLCDATVWIWGRNDWGQLGQNNGTNSNYAIQVKNNAGNGFLTNIIKIEAGDNYCMALSNLDTLWSWGSNAFGQLGISSPITRRSLPTYVHSFSSVGKLSGVVNIAAGQGHTIALLSNGTVASWGKNNSGQLGNNSTINSRSPLQVLDATGSFPLSNINYIVTGDIFSLVRTSNNQLYIWGDNTSGQLGLGDNNNRLLPASLTLPCEPNTDLWPSNGRISPSFVVCEGQNNGNFYLNKHSSAISEWQQSIDNFATFNSIYQKNSSIFFTNITQPIYFRAVLIECQNYSYSPIATISVDALSKPAKTTPSDTVREGNNNGIVRLRRQNGSVLQWESSFDNFYSNSNTIKLISDSLIYSNLYKTTYFRALTKSGVCPAVYSDTTEIKTINSGDVIFYNSFTPNGDHYNDEWVIEYIEHFPENKVDIYNRWGQLVFSAKGYDNTSRIWKGENNASGTLGGNILADDTYFYFVTLGENLDIINGHVVIRR